MYRNSHVALHLTESALKRALLSAAVIVAQMSSTLNPAQARCAVRSQKFLHVSHSIVVSLPHELDAADEFLAAEKLWIRGLLLASGLGTLSGVGRLPS